MSIVKRPWVATVWEKMSGGKGAPFNKRVAFLLAVCISLLMNVMFLIMFIFSRESASVSYEESGHLLRPDITFMRICFTFTVAFSLYNIYFRLLNHSWFSRRENSAYAILLLMLCTATISMGCTWLRLNLESYPAEGYKWVIIGSMVSDYFLTIVIILSSQLLYYYNKQQKTLIEHEALQAKYMRARFMVLKKQLDPHFLFNSLNTLNSLIKVDADKAQEYIQQLSFVFRYTLQNKEIITLEEELKFTLAYCHLMQIRYGSSLLFATRVDEAYFPRFIVPLSLQTLTENAIKHNVASNKQPLTVNISTTDAGTIMVANRIQPKIDTETGEGIGLSNLSERYRLLWDKEIVIRNTGEMFEVEIPLIR
jgi:sensor histidine kinase YesM